MDETNSPVDWADVDDAADPESFRSYLDAVTGLEGFREVKRRSYRFLAPEPGNSLLDVGCGTGDDVRALAGAVGSDGRVVGVDASAAMVETARDRSSDRETVSFRVADAEALPFDDGAFDGCRADRVLQHLERPRTALEELRRVVRPGGRVVVTDPDWGTLTVDAGGDARGDGDRDAPGDSDAVGERLTAPEWSCARNPRIGRRLRRRAVETGLEDVEVDASTVAFTDLETADEVLGLTGYAERVREADALPAESTRRWLESLRERDGAGTFWASLELVTVAGTRADPA